MKLNSYAETFGELQLEEELAAEREAHELTKKALASATADCERFQAQVKQLEQELAQMRWERAEALTKGGWA